MDVLIINGYDTVSAISKIKNKSILQDIGIGLKGHQLQLLSKSKKLINGSDDKFLSKYFNMLDLMNANVRYKIYEFKNASNHMQHPKEILSCSSSPEKCQHIQRLVNILIEYEGWNQEQDHLGETNNTLRYEPIVYVLRNIDMTKLLDDHHHYRDNHDDMRNVLYLHERFTEVMPNGCKRSHDLENNEYLARLQKTMNISNECIAKLQLLDILHYELHTNAH